MRSSTVDDCHWVTVPTATDPRGSVSWLQEDAPLPFAPKRIYYLHGLTKGIVRGEHGHKALEQIIIGFGESGDRGVFVRSGLWRRLIPKDDGAICLVIASDKYMESDYIRGFDDFMEWKQCERSER